MSGIKLRNSAADIAHMRKDWREASYFDAADELPGLLSDHDTLRTANQRLEGEVKRLREAGSALSNIAYNLAQRPGVTLDVIVCDTLSSARKSWDAVLSTANGEVT